MNEKIFATTLSDDKEEYFYAETKKDAVEKLKKELDYDNLIKMCDPQDRKSWKEVISSVREIKDELQKKWFGLFLNINKGRVILPSFFIGGKDYRLLREWAENKFDGKIVQNYQFENIQKNIKRVELIDKYYKLKERLIKLAEYLKEDDASAMV